MSPINFATMRVRPTGHARLTPDGSSLAFESTFSRELVDEFKRQIPAEARKWDASGKRWLVAPEYASICCALASQFLGVTLTPPTVSTSVQTETRLLKLEYLGRPKDRNGTSSASGYVDGGWNAIFPETVLRTWFDSPQSPTELATFYSVLAVKQIATADEIRSAHRRLARTWHPDVCHEPDAAEQFKRIQRAYEVLSEPMTRRKYDAGLYLQAQAAKADEPRETYREATFCPPYRCGYVLANGQEIVGRFVVSEICQWEDVVNRQGQVMVTSWPNGADMFEVRWT